MKEFFSRKGPLLELIFEMHSFNFEELRRRYHMIPDQYPESDEVIRDYLDQLVVIRILKKIKGRFVVRASALR